jgi:hypothetical protein
VLRERNIAEDIWLKEAMLILSPHYLVSRKVTAFVHWPCTAKSSAAEALKIYHPDRKGDFGKSSILSVRETIPQKGSLCFDHINFKTKIFDSELCRIQNSWDLVSLGIINCSTAPSVAFLVNDALRV